MKWKPFEDFLIRYRIVISALIIAALIYEDFNEGLIPQNMLDLRNPLSIAAIAFVATGLFMRSWAAGVIRKTKQLAVTGPYALTRHPLYVGSLLLGIGFSLVMWDNENIWFILALAGVLYIPKIRREERHLSAQFSKEWAAYCNETGLFFPKRFPDLHSTWSAKQWAYNREYNALITSLVLLAVLTTISTIAERSMS